MQKPTQKGFALAAVLWLMAGLSIVLALVADATKATAERVAQLRERTGFVRSALGGRAQAEYWLSAARPRTADFFDGTNAVMADNTPYQIDAHSTIALQDNGGLIDLNRADSAILTNFLIGCGVSAERAPYLIDALADYVDSDNLQRLNGAERDTYTLHGLPPPRNSLLLSQPEVWDVYGWKPYRQDFERNGCDRSLTVYGEASMLGISLNLATAPAPVLKAAGLNEELINDIVTARGDPAKVAERVAQNNELLGTGGLFGGAGGKQVQKVLRVTHRHSTGPWKMTYVLTLDPENDDRPWSVTQPVMEAELPPVDKISILPWPNQPPLSQPVDAARRLPLQPSRP